MKKFFSLIIIIIIFSISSSKNIEKNKLEENHLLVRKNILSQEKEKIPPGQNKIPPGQLKKHDKSKEKESNSELSIFQMFIIGAFIILFIFLLVYFIINNVNKRHQQNENNIYNRIHMLMKLSDSKIKKENNKNNQIEDNKDAPSTAFENYSKKENISLSSIDDNENDFSNNIINETLSNKIIKPTEEDLKLYKPYDIEDDNNNSIKIELQDKKLI
jgi:uncharacterized protein YxeA